MFMRPFLSLFFCLLLMMSAVASPCQAGIVNTLRISSSDQAGWSGGFSGSHSAQGGNSRVTKLSFSSLVQYRYGNDLLRLIGSGKRSSSGGVESGRAFMGHLRHNRRLGGPWSTLAFAQWQENPFQRLESRRLLGLGARCDLLAREGLDLALGGAFMWEREQIQDGPGATTGQRLSLFLSLVYPVTSRVSVDALVFFQPAVSEFADHRLFAQGDLKVEITGSLSLFTGVQVEEDSRPAGGVARTDWETSTGFSYDF
jgi:hypothetical protein|nr:DUF481 domain-containing protein [Candidatus Krumholzibacteria bacterium]